jgi:hypothetical protein
MTNAKTQGPTTPTLEPIPRRVTPIARPGEAAAHWIAQGIDASTALRWENID